MPNPFKALKALKKVERVTDVIEAPKELKVPHPLNPNEVYTFPPGTDPEFAKNYIRRMLVIKAREGMKEIELPSELPDERVLALKKSEEELERAKRTIADLESRKDLRNMSPGIYQDENTGRYYRVTNQGFIEELIAEQIPE